MRAYKFFAVFVGIVLAALLSELILRAYNHRNFTHPALELNPTGLIYAPKPSGKYTNKFGITVRYNSLGFIGNEIGPKQKGIPRILGLGDSVTEAAYLPAAENYLNRSAAILSKKIGREVEAINAAVSGYNSWQELELLCLKGLSVQPDLIIVGVCQNDLVLAKARLRDDGSRGIFENYRDGSRARYFDFIYQRCDLYKFIYDFVVKTRLGLYGDRGYMRYLQNYNFTITVEDLKQWQQPLLEMAKIAQENNIQIVFVLFPLESQIVQKMEYSCEPLEGVLRKKGIYYIDLINCFAKNYAGKGPLYIRRDIVHLSALGHEIASQEIAEYILKNGLLGK